MEFKKRDVVKWESQSHGKYTIKIGRIIYVVPKNCNPVRFLSTIDRETCKFMFDGVPRNHESYIVKVYERFSRTQPRLYWPLVKNLKKISESEIGLD